MNKYMEEANKLAQENLKTNNGGPFGAVIVKNGKIIGKGNNHVLKDNDPTAHAEIVAIRNACNKLKTYDLNDCEIYTTCFPCPMCMSAIIGSNIKEIYYGNTKEDADKIGFKDDMLYHLLKHMNIEKNNLKIIELKQLNRRDTIKTFNAFDKKEDKTTY